MVVGDTGSNLSDAASWLGESVFLQILSMNGQTDLVLAVRMCGNLGFETDKCGDIIRSIVNQYLSFFHLEVETFHRIPTCRVLGI